MNKLTNDEVAEFYENLSDPRKSVQLILSLFLTVLCGVTVKYLWLWFMTPFGLPPISLLHAIGLDQFVSFIVTTQAQPPRSYGRFFWWRFIHGTCFALVALVVGYLIYLCM